MSQSLSLRSTSWSATVVFLGLGGLFLLLAVATLWFRYPFYIASAVPVVLFGALFLAKNPRLSLYLTVAFTFMPMLEVGPMTGFQVTAGLAVVGAATDLAIRRILPRLTPLFPVYIAFAGVILLSLTFAPETPIVLMSLYRWIRNLALVLLLVNYISDRRQLRTVYGVILAFAAFNALWGVLEYVSAGQGVYRSRGLMGDPNRMACGLCLAMPVALRLFLENRDRLRRFLGAGLTALLLVGLVTTSSRGGTAACLVGLVVFSLMNRRMWPWLGVLALLVALSLPLVPEYTWQRFADIDQQIAGTVQMGEVDLTDRGFLNRAALNMWRRHPVLGVGAGHFPVYYGQMGYNPGYLMGWEKSAHNMYLQALSENGLVGFALLLCLLATAAATLRRTWRGISASGDTQLRSDMAVLLAMMASVLTVSGTLSFLYAREVHLMLGLVMAFPVVAGLSSRPFSREGRV